MSDFATIQEYWKNPEPFDTERAWKRRQFEQAMAAHDAREKAKREARWAEEEGE
jgi:hypothetical protein